MMMTMMMISFFISFHFISFHLVKATKGQMATDMLNVRQNMMRLIATMNTSCIKPLNYYTAAIINTFTV